jgi:hypothetical protein
MRLPRLLAMVILVEMILPSISASSALAASSIPPCASDQLSVLLSNTQGFAGTGVMAIDIANRGVTCRIGGYPQVSFITGKGVVVDRHDIHVSSQYFAEPRSKLVTLSYEGSASIGISWSDNTVNNQPYNTTCPLTVSVSVVLLHGVGHLSGLLPVSVRPCGGGVEVTAIEAGSWPRTTT